MEIYEITGNDLRMFLGELGAQTDPAKNGIHTVRVAIDDGTVKVKVNGYTWSPPLGKREN
jgi:hypothetical protein